MRVLRFLLAAIVLVAAMFAGFFALAVVAVLGLLALLIQAFWRKRSAPGNSQPPPKTDTGDGEVIDVVATEESTESSPRDLLKG